MFRSAADRFGSFVPLRDPLLLALAGHGLRSNLLGQEFS